MNTYQYCKPQVASQFTPLLETFVSSIVLYCMTLLNDETLKNKTRLPLYQIFFLNMLVAFKKRAGAVSCADVTSSVRRTAAHTSLRQKVAAANKKKKNSRKFVIKTEPSIKTDPSVTTVPESTDVKPSPPVLLTLPVCVITRLNRSRSGIS